MKWEEALAILDCRSTTCADKAAKFSSSQYDKWVVAPGINQQPFGLPPSVRLEPVGSSATTLKPPSFWEFIQDGDSRVLLAGNGLLNQLGYATQSQRIREVIEARYPTKFTAQTGMYPANTELEQLMAGMEESEKREYRIAIVEALGIIIGDGSRGKARAAKFLSQFGEVFTLNLDTFQPMIYDYINGNFEDRRTSKADGTSGRKGNSVATRFKDGFIMIEDVGEWSDTSEQNWHYPHGSFIIVFSDSDGKYHKFRWDIVSDKVELREQLQALNATPVMILDSNADAKLSVILNDDYLRKCWRALGDINGSLYVYGLGLFKDTDSHIWTLIDDNPNDLKIFIAVKIVTRATLERVKTLLPKKHRSVRFFDRDSI